LDLLRNLKNEIFSDNLKKVVILLLPFWELKILKKFFIGESLKSVSNYFLELNFWEPERLGTVLNVLLR